MDTTVEETTLDATMKKKKPNVRRTWTVSEETSLIQRVVDNEQVLFGEMKGPGIKKLKRKRKEVWAEIAHSLNAQNPEVKRQADVVKKKYFNIKQRAKEKIDEIKKSFRQTGGGPPPPSLTEAEEVCADSMEGRPVAHGITGAIDTDEPEPQSSNGEDDTLHQDAIELSSNDLEMSRADDASHAEDRNKRCGKKGKKGKKKETEEDPIAENVNEDTKRIKLEQKKLELEIEVLKKNKDSLDAQIQLQELKKTYYMCKLQSFGVVFTDITDTQSDAIQQ